MKAYIRKCVICGKYTLSSEHCGAGTVSPHPHKFSPKDPYMKYRLKKYIKEEDYE